ncbi:MAG TPA: response regulator [Rhodobacterales bacterium]|nr:response regulator [Rhodobacterales bacterium]
MKVLIVEGSEELGGLWARVLTRNAMDVTLTATEDGAIAHLQTSETPNIIIADLDLPGAGAMAVADYAAYRHPDARIIFVTAASFFSDGSIFAHSPNACAFLPARTAPEDLAAVVEFHGQRNRAARG